MPSLCGFPDIHRGTNHVVGHNMLQEDSSFIYLDESEAENCVKIILLLLFTIMPSPPSYWVGHQSLEGQGKLKTNAEDIRVPPFTETVQSVLPFSYRFADYNGPLDLVQRSNSSASCFIQMLQRSHTSRSLRQ